MKRRICIFFVLLAVLCTAAFADSVETTVYEIQQYGNLILNIAASELEQEGYTYGDIIRVVLNGNAYEMPVGSNYADVDQGSPICRFIQDNDRDYVILAINHGDLATMAGLATKETTEADPGYVWHIAEGVGEPIPVAISMSEKGGYLDEYLLRELTRTDNRDDYPTLTDEEFANFRVVSTTGVCLGKLYRTSSPVNPSIGRNQYADAAAQNAGVKTILNLADNNEVMRSYEGYSDTYYSMQTIIALNMGIDFEEESYRTALADGFRFIAANEAPYLVHCLEGKDRTGFACAILECLMGASLEEVVDDYMVSFTNFYSVLPGTEQYDVIAESNIRGMLKTAFELQSLEEANLAIEAEEYLFEIGMTADEIEQLRASIGE